MYSLINLKTNEYSSESVTLAAGCEKFKQKRVFHSEEGETGRSAERPVTDALCGGGGMLGNVGSRV